MGRQLNQRIRRTALAGTVAAWLLAVPAAAAMAAAPTPVKILPKPTGITFPQLKKVKGKKSDCLIARSCDRADFASIAGQSDGRPAAVFVSEIARHPAAKAAKKVMAKRWTGLLAERHDPEAGFLGGNVSELLLTKSTAGGYQVFTEDGLIVSGDGVRIHAVFVRKGARIVWVQAFQPSWSANGDLPVLVAKAKASLRKSWQKVPLAKPPKY